MLATTTDPLTSYNCSGAPGTSDSSLSLSRKVPKGSESKGSVAAVFPIKLSLVPSKIRRLTSEAPVGVSARCSLLAHVVLRYAIRRQSDKMVGANG